MLYDLAEQSLTYVKTHSPRYLISDSQVNILQAKYLKAVASLDQFLKVDQKN